MLTLAQWMKKATPEQRKLLAKKGKTSVAYLRQLASGHRKASMEMAFTIEQITATTPSFLKLDYVEKESLNKTWKKLLLDTSKAY